MHLLLFHRSYGCHSLLETIEIDLKFSDVVKHPKDPNADFEIDEFSIFLKIPEWFLRADSREILLTVGNDHGSTAQRYPSFFRHWGKYFPSYVLELHK